MENALRLLFRPGDTFEVRALGATVPGWRTPHTEAGYFNYDSIEDVPEAISALAMYSGVYATINPVAPALLARANKRLTAAQRGAATSDGDILRRQWLFLDVDPDRPSGISATQAEKDYAHTVATGLRNTLAARGWPEPIEVDSGNGFYLLYRVDLPADDGGLVHRILKSCASMADTDTVHIDTAVANAARIVRIPGTWNRKGDNLPDRPHRKAAIINAPFPLVPVSQDLLETLAGPKVTPPKKVHTIKQDIPGNKPGDIYNQRGDLAELLTNHGWQPVGETQGNQLWRRPGKEGGNHSATWNGDVFYVFSSNAQPFEANKGYSAFGAYTLLEHDGDARAAAQALARQGYQSYGGTSITMAPGVDLQPFLAQFNPKPIETPIPDTLLNPGGFMGQVIKFNLDTAPKPQPLLALAGALALQAVLCARKIKTIYGTRPNIMVCGVAPSGAGKEHARSLTRRILVEAGLSHLHAEGIKSGSALVNALVVNPALLFQLDEFGRFLKATKNPEKNPYAYEIISKLLTLYTSSGSLYETDRYADKEKGGQRIQDPHAIIHGTTVPTSLYEGLTEEAVTDGFLARTLIFDVDGVHPQRRILPERDIPGDILDRAKWWGAYNPGGGNLAPEARTIKVSRDAQALALDFVRKEDQEIQSMADSPLATLWTRTAQNADKLALLYAISVDPECPAIDLPAATWGYALAEYLTRRMIRLVGDNVSQNRFHGEVLRVRQILSRAGGKMERWTLVKKSKMRARELDEIIEHLIQSQSLHMEETSTGGRKRMQYVLD